MGRVLRWAEGLRTPTAAYKQRIIRVRERAQPSLEGSLPRSGNKSDRSPLARSI